MHEFSVTWSFFIIFGVSKVWILIPLLQTVLFWQISVIVALFAYVACLMFLFVDRSIKYAEAFSMQCLIIILVIYYSREC